MTCTPSALVHSRRRMPPPGPGLGAVSKGWCRSYPSLRGNRVQTESSGAAPPPTGARNCKSSSCVSGAYLACLLPICVQDRLHGEGPKCSCLVWEVMALGILVTEPVLLSGSLSFQTPSHSPHSPLLPSGTQSCALCQQCPDHSHLCSISPTLLPWPLPVL